MEIINKQDLQFTVGSGLKNIIGKDLITNDTVAIFELVKNSYDADASEVSINFDILNDQIIITDNGTGMSFDDIVNKWLFVAYSEKSILTDKVYAGSKGIGRFSCDRLGSKLHLISKNSIMTNHLEVNWSAFESSKTDEFSSISIPFYQTNDNDDFLGKDRGTKLIISGLRDTWDYKKINQTKKQLVSLINPLESANTFKITVSTNLRDHISIETLSNPIKEVLSEKTISIDCIVNVDNISIKLIDSGIVVYNVLLENKSIIKNARFLVYYLNLSAKMNFKRIMKTENKNYGSLFVYRNNFRVMPYGEPDYDGFGLNLRKAQGYTRYLAHRELLGWILINDSANNFNESTSRDSGFIKNIYTTTFEDLYFSLVQRPLEDYVQLTKFGKTDIDDIITNADDMYLHDNLIGRFKNYKIISKQFHNLPKKYNTIETKLESLVNPELSEDDKNKLRDDIKDVLENQEKQIKDKEREAQELKADRDNLKRQNEIKSMILLRKKPERHDFLEHELKNISSEIIAINQEVLDNPTIVDKSRIIKYITMYQKQAQKLNVVQQLVMRVDNDTKVSKSKIEINSYFRMYFENIVNKGKLKKIDLELDEKGTIFQNINIFEFGIIIDNLLSNARDLDATTIKIISNTNGFSFISDTKAIPDSIINNIFDLGFTTKEFGTGLGLYIVKEICKSFGWSISVQNLNSKLVSFDIKYGAKK